MAERTDNPQPAAPAPAELTVWQRIKNGFSAVGRGIVSSVLWTGGLFAASYGLGRLARSQNWSQAERYDFWGIAAAVEGQEAGKIAGNLARKAMVPLGIGAAINFGIGALMPPGAQAGTLSPPANLPNDPQQARNNGQHNTPDSRQS